MLEAPFAVTITGWFVPVPAGSEHVTVVEEELETGQAAPPMVTLGVGWKLAPLRVIEIPPWVGPLVGEMLAIVGVAAVTVTVELLTAVPIACPSDGVAAHFTFAPATAVPAGSVEPDPAELVAPLIDQL